MLNIEAGLMEEVDSIGLLTWIDMLSSVGIAASYSVVIRDSENTQVVADGDGVYEVTVEESYTFALNWVLIFTTPGTFTVELPEGMCGDDKTVTLYASGNVSIGYATFDYTNHLLTITYIDAVQSYSDVTGSASASFEFEQKGTWHLLGDVSISAVTHGPEDETGVNKAGSYNSIDDGELNWTVVLTGQAHSVLVGTTIEDEITTTDSHYYAAADIANGITITATYTDPDDSTNTATYTWTVHESDMDYWNETGWSYTIPETVALDNGGTLTLPTYGGEGWVIVLTYTSTFTDDFDSTHATVFGNTVTMEGSDEGSVIYTPDCGIDKTGVFYAAGEPYEDSYVEWTVTAYIPAVSGGTSVYNVQVQDERSIQLQKDGGLIYIL